MNVTAIRVSTEALVLKEPITTRVHVLLVIPVQVVKQVSL